MTYIRGGTSRQAKILVVDNEHKIALGLCAILQNQGYAVATAFSGEDAVAVAAGFTPDLLVSDVRVGDASGVKIATQITAMVPHCSVLFLSSLASMSDVLKVAPKRLVYSFVSKPLRVLDLFNAIAYQLPAVSTFEDPAMMAMGYDMIPLDAIGWMSTIVGCV